MIDLDGATLGRPGEVAGVRPCGATLLGAEFAVVGIDVVGDGGFLVHDHQRVGVPVVAGVGTLGPFLRLVENLANPVVQSLVIGLAIRAGDACLELVPTAEKCGA